MSEEGEEGYLYLALKKLTVTVQKQVLFVLLTRGRNYRGVPQKPNSGSISVVLTLGRYYRGPG
jgi:hypothetical protein